MAAGYFLHVPKTAGTSVTAALSNAFGEVWPVNTLDGLENATRKELEGQTLFAGHFGLALPEKIPVAWTATVLRHPVDRVVSHHRFLQSIPQYDTPGVHRSLETLLDDPEWAPMFNNLQTRYLGFLPGRRTERCAPKGVSLPRMWAFETMKLDDPGRVADQARRTLADAVAGVSENLDEFAGRLSERTGIRVTIPDFMHNAAPTKAAAISQSLRRRLEDLNKIDFELWETARS